MQQPVKIDEMVTGGVDEAGGFSERARSWRREAITQAAIEMLATAGCISFNMDELAAKIGVSKGTIYEYFASREDLIEDVLSRWMEDVSMGNADQAENPARASMDAIEALLTDTERAGLLGPAVPCCLHVSPCPHGWTARWQSICASYGLESDDVQFLGEALQALASLPTLRSLIGQGKNAEVRSMVQVMLSGYFSASR